MKPVYRCRSRWENLDRGQYRFQPIKFVNSVVPSPCETQPYNNVFFLATALFELYIKIEIINTVFRDDYPCEHFKATSLGLDYDHMSKENSE